MSWLSDKLGVEYETDDPGGYVQKTFRDKVQVAETTGQKAIYWICASIVIPGCIYVTFPNASKTLIDKTMDWFKSTQPEKTHVEKVKESRVIYDNSILP
jgi:hypothetical protein